MQSYKTALLQRINQVIYEISITVSWATQFLSGDLQPGEICPGIGFERICPDLLAFGNRALR